ncbi:hypothetical protein SEUCBS139899_002034 [Sporothrix eucalyptigena]|uniref:Cytochrome P450 n=1 Tax=Sporothrix eucalyptigena TaxID=1812306 RepID=A0ABP0CCS6_9PEZI
MWSIYRGLHHLDDLQLHARYGPVVRLAPNLVSVSDPAEISQIYGITTKFIKSPFYDLSAVYDEEGLVPDPFVLRKDKGLHARMKRNAANGYSMNGLVKCEPWIEPVMDRLIAILDQHADAQTVCDLGDLMKRFAMDAVLSLTFGHDLSYLERGDHYGFFPIVDLFTAYMAIFGGVAWLHPFLLGNAKITKYVTRGDSSQKAMLDLANAELEASRENPPDENAPMTFLARLSLNQIANPKALTDREIITHAFGNISAGSDTTAIAIRSVFFYLLSNPAAYSRLCTEVRQGLEAPVSFTKANELPYLRATIQEAMRMHPSVGQILGRIVPAEGATICGYRFVGNTEVGMSPWVLHRDPDIFPEPDTFKPERWLLGECGSTEDQLREMNRSFFAFGHGTHTCSGKHISIMEVTKLVGTILLRYDLELVDGGKGYQFTNWWFTQQKGLLIRLRRRY